MPKTTEPVRRRRLLKLALPAALALASLSLLAGSAFPKADPDSGRPTIAKKKHKKITGKIRAEGVYTVIALAANGKAKTKRAPKGAFKLRPPAKKVTLHLRASDGTYAGPVVVGKRKGGKRAIEGVYAGAKLGKVKVKVGQGYAKAKLPKKWTDEKREARAKRGVPIGAGNFGRVRSKKTHGGAPGDLDLDGVADPLDIDDDGDLVLDNLDRKPRKGSKARAPGDSGLASGDFGLKSATLGDVSSAVNANAGFTDERIEAALPRNVLLYVSILPGDAAELDCGQPQSSADPGLAYCTLGGTGILYDNFVDPARTPFPECCDPDGDGFGTLVPNTGSGSPGSTFLIPFATSDQIGSGDVMIQRVTTDGVETQFVATLQYIFASNPTLVSYDDGQGNSPTLSYPVEYGGPGTEADPFPVKAGPNGDVVVELTFWRPQRRPIPPETADWIDIGGLHHTAVPYTGGRGHCEQDAYSSSDPNLAPVIADPDWIADFGTGGGFTDLAADRPASPDNTLTYRLNLTECLEKSTGSSFDPGQTRGFRFTAFADPDPGRGADSTQTSVYFQR